MVSIPWRQILTTNFDLLVEKSFDLIKETSNYLLDILPIRSVKEYHSLLSCNEIKYIKFHGCLSDRSKYPFIISSQDILKVKSFYKAVLNGIKDPSEKIKFLAIGYSFSDEFAYSFIETLDSQGYRDRKWLINVDPFVNTSMLGYYTSKKICVVKLTCDEFFSRYKLWEETTFVNKQKNTKSLSIKNSNESTISIPAKLSYNLRHSIIQLNSSYRGEFISEKEFYLGEEPNFNIVLRNFDVVKSSVIEKCFNQIIEKLKSEKSSLLPIFLLNGTFGIGKTTLTFRLINKFISQKDIDLVAFEIKEIENLKVSDLTELINHVHSNHFLLYVNNLEIDSKFKSLMALRMELSSRQLSGTHIFFLASMRSNIFEKFKLKTDYRNLFEFGIDGHLNDLEVEQFVVRLKNCGLISYRDSRERNEIVERIKNEFGSDSFVSLVRLVSKGKHIDNLRDAYFQLSPDTRSAFIYTALLHRFNLLTPAGLLKQIISKDWDTFKKDVIEVEGKGLLLQEEISSKDFEPDLYFKTKHSIIADLLIKEILQSHDKIYDHYKTIVTHISQSNKMTRLLIDLLKSITNSDEVAFEKINKLYDLGYNNLQEDPHFILNYCINLQRRKGKNDLLRAWELLIYAESLLEYRNDKFLHRRGVIAFELSKIYYKEEIVELNFCLKYLNEAKELFTLKQLLDPCSSYSYYDYISLLMWELEKINKEKESELKLKLQIEDQIEIALSSITEGTNRILSLKTKYIEKHKLNQESKEYLDQIEVMYEDETLRPYSCILKYNYYKDKDDYVTCYELIDEMMNYVDNIEVVKFLFKIFSHKLNYVKYRIKFFTLAKSIDSERELKSLSYNYFWFVAESYNGNYSYANSYLSNIKTKFHSINPDYQQIWKESDSESPRIFEGTIVKKRTGYLNFKPFELQYKFYLRTGEYKKVKEGDKVKARLHFFLNGIRTEIVEKS